MQLNVGSMTIYMLWYISNQHAIWGGGIFTCSSMSHLHATCHVWSHPCLIIKHTLFADRHYLQIWQKGWLKYGQVGHDIMALCSLPLLLSLNQPHADSINHSHTNVAFAM